MLLRRKDHYSSGSQGRIKNWSWAKIISKAGGEQGGKILICHSTERVFHEHNNYTSSMQLFGFRRTLIF